MARLRPHMHPIVSTSQLKFYQGECPWLLVVLGHFTVVPIALHSIHCSEIYRPHTVLQKPQPHSWDVIALLSCKHAVMVHQPCIGNKIIVVCVYIALGKDPDWVRQNRHAVCSPLVLTSHKLIRFCYNGCTCSLLAILPTSSFLTLSHLITIIIIVQSTLPVYSWCGRL